MGAEEKRARPMCTVTTPPLKGAMTPRMIDGRLVQGAKRRGGEGRRPLLKGGAQRREERRALMQAYKEPIHDATAFAPGELAAGLARLGCR